MCSLSRKHLLKYVCGIFKLQTDAWLKCKATVGGFRSYKYKKAIIKFSSEILDEKQALFLAHTG